MLYLVQIYIRCSQLPQTLFHVLQNRLPAETTIIGITSHVVIGHEATLGRNNETISIMSTDNMLDY